MFGVQTFPTQRLEHVGSWSGARPLFSCDPVLPPPLPPPAQRGKWSVSQNGRDMRYGTSGVTAVWKGERLHVSSATMPPSTNHLYGRQKWRKGGGCYLLPPVRAFRLGVQRAVTAHARVFPADAPLRVRYAMCARRTDIDAPIKSCLDALQHAGLFRDDALVTRLRGRKCRCGGCRVPFQVVVSLVRTGVVGASGPVLREAAPDPGAAAAALQEPRWCLES